MNKKLHQFERKSNLLWMDMNPCVIPHKSTAQILVNELKKEYKNVEIYYKTVTLPDGNGEGNIIYMKFRSKADEAEFIMRECL